jgi:hypothetical protein
MVSLPLPPQHDPEEYSLNENTRDRLGHHAFHRILSRHSNTYSMILLSLRRHLSPFTRTSQRLPNFKDTKGQQHNERLNKTMHKQLKRVIGFQGNKFAERG